MPDSFRLLRGDAVLGIVTFDPKECDFPWKGGWLKPTDAFAQVEPMFREWDRLLEAEEYGGAEALFEEISRPGIRLQPLEDDRVEEEILGIRIQTGNRVIWRSVPRSSN